MTSLFMLKMGIIGYILILVTIVILGQMFRHIQARCADRERIEAQARHIICDLGDERRLVSAHSLNRICYINEGLPGEAKRTWVRLVRTPLGLMFQVETAHFVNEDDKIEASRIVEALRGEGVLAQYVHNASPPSSRRFASW